MVAREFAGNGGELKRDEGEMKEPASYFRYWGKAEKAGLGYHLLPYHCLDMAASAGWSCYMMGDMGQLQ